MAWKAGTDTLPEEARVPARYAARPVGGPYDFCLPLEFAELSLLPEVREVAQRLFAEVGIRWHDGVGSGPSNHLLSSQVQCVNALGQMVRDPARVWAAFGQVMAVGEVVEVEPGRFLTFEFVGEFDYFGEGRGGVRTRGANCTSVDAAFQHVTADGVRELVLVEWKYTESYGAHAPNPVSDEVRESRFGSALAAADSPVRSGLMAFEDFLHEPFYQFVRQQLLAWALERDERVPVDRVRVVHVCPSDNLAYQRSLHSAAQRRLGDTVSEVWQALLARTDRFVSVDAALFLDPGITSGEYVARYGSGG